MVRGAFTSMTDNRESSTFPNLILSSELRRFDLICDGISASSASNATDAKTPIVSAEEAPAKDASGADEVVEPVWEEFAAEEPAAPAKEDDSSAATEQQSALTPGCALGVHEISRRLTPTDTRTPASPESHVEAV